MQQEIVSEQKKQLPEGWRWSRIEKVCRTKPQSGGTPLSSNPTYYGGEIPWVITEDMTNAGMYISDTQKKITKDGLENSNAKYFPEGTILFAMYGSIGRMSITSRELTTNQAILGLVPDTNQILTKYLYYYLDFAKKYLIRRGRGGTQANINAKMICTFPIIIPPLSEQKKIVEKLDKQMVQIEIMKKEADTQLESAENYNISFLNKIVNEQLSRWKFKKFGEIFTTRYGLSKKSVNDRSKIKALRMNNISYDGEIVLNDLCYLDLNKDEIHKHKLMKGDIIFNRTNSAELVGKTTVFNQDDTFVAVSYLVIASAKTPEINPEYVSLYLNSSKIKKYFYENCDRAISQANFNASKLNEILIPVPELKEQNSIISKIKKKKKISVEIKKDIQNQSSAICQLSLSILNNVFGHYEIPEEL
jgi:type I restriction enzyme, S subunit